MNKKIAIVRVRGGVKMNTHIIATLNMLRLYRNQSCVVVTNTPSFVGMLRKVKDYVTWGEIDEKTFKELLLKRGKLPAKQKLTEEYLKQKINMGVEEFAKEFFSFKKDLKDVPGLKIFFKLHPPTKGFERKGIKKPFSLGGVLGYRKDKINDLIMRML